MTAGGEYDLTERDHHALSACAKAADLLRSFGFQHKRTAMKTESCYYGLPDYDGTIRISAHRYNRSEARANGFPVLSMVTFGHNQGKVSDIAVHDRVITALGNYFARRLNASYKGPAGSQKSPKSFP